MAGSPDPKAGRIVDRDLTLFVPRGEGYQGHSPWLVRCASALRANSLRIRTGNFSLPCRELNQAITESLGRIRDEGAAIGRPGFLAAWRQSRKSLWSSRRWKPDRNALAALFKGLHRHRCDASRERYVVKKAFAGLVTQAELGPCCE